MSETKTFSKTIYRQCDCGETAHDAKYCIGRQAYFWACRNCGWLARGRNGLVRELAKKGS